VLALVFGVLAALSVAAVATSTGGSDQSAGVPPPHASPPASPGGAPSARAPTPPRRTPAARQPLRGEQRAIDGTLRYTAFVTAGTARRREVALSFDDGPGPYTEAIVHTLSRTHAPATFFIVGQQLGSFGQILRDEIRGGFEIGDHTENHVWLTRVGAAAQYKQINDAALRAVSAPVSAALWRRQSSSVAGPARAPHAHGAVVR
jgi:hypothetical protein